MGLFCRIFRLGVGAFAVCDPRFLGVVLRRSAARRYGGRGRIKRLLKAVFDVLFGRFLGGVFVPVARTRNLTRRQSRWVRKIAPPLPCRKPCRAEQIPVQNLDGSMPERFCAQILIILRYSSCRPTNSKFPYLFAARTH